MRKLRRHKIVAKVQQLIDLLATDQDSKYKEFQNQQKNRVKP